MKHLVLVLMMLTLVFPLTSIARDLETTETRFGQRKMEKSIEALQNGSCNDGVWKLFFYSLRSQCVQIYSLHRENFESFGVLNEAVFTRAILRDGDRCEIWLASFHAQTLQFELCKMKMKGAEYSLQWMPQPKHD